MASSGVSIAPVVPDESRTCLCGDPAQYVVETIWNRGRCSRDPVCEPHLDVVVGAVRAKLAERNGVVNGG